MLRHGHTASFRLSFATLAPLFALAFAALTNEARADEPKATGPRPPLVPSAAPAASDAAPPPAPTEPVIDPARDQRELAAQGEGRSLDGSVGSAPSDVYSDEWWGRVRPVVELHGYFRLRAELLHNFGLGRHDVPGDQNVNANNPNLWPQPLDYGYSGVTGAERAVILCDSTADSKCNDKSQASANIRFRLTPELHISDNLFIRAQIDALDNLVLGSTPDSGDVTAGAKTRNGAYSPTDSRSANPYAPLAYQSTTQGPPTAGVNGYRNSIDVKRVWAEYRTPVGQLRFGRMPFQWGLGMVYNAGDGIDSDYQTTVDRIQFVSGIKAIDLYMGGSWDFPASGPTSATPWDAYGGQPYSLGNLLNVNQWSLFIAKKKPPALQRLALSRGDVVVNGGVLATYRTQFLDTTAVDAKDLAPPNNGLVRRGAYVFTPDFWVQATWRKLRVEAEFAAIVGNVDQTPDSNDWNNPVKIRQYGLATQTEYRAVEDKLKLQFGFGWASGDPWVRTLNPGYEGWQQELNSGRGPISTFRFHPDYRVDLIFFRRMLTRVEGSYYFRPSVDYDFIRQNNGQKFGGGAAIIWSRATEFMQTPGHKRDLGVELDLQLYYQAKDGSLNDDPSKLGGFYAMLQYGVFFPLGGLSYLPGEQTSALSNWDTSTAQTVRLFLGVVF